MEAFLLITVSLEQVLLHILNEQKLYSLHWTWDPQCDQWKNKTYQTLHPVHRPIFSGLLGKNPIDIRTSLLQLQLYHGPTKVRKK